MNRAEEVANESYGVFQRKLSESAFPENVKREAHAFMEWLRQSHGSQPNIQVWTPEMLSGAVNVDYIEVSGGKYVPVENAASGCLYFGMDVNFHRDGRIDVCADPCDEVPVGASFKYLTPLTDVLDTTLEEAKRIWRDVGHI